MRRALDDPQAVPVTDWVAELQRLAGRVRNAVDAVGGRVNALQEMRFTSGAQSEQLRAEVVVWERLLGRLESVLTAMGRLDIGERMVRLRAEEVRLMAAEIAVLLAGLGRDDPGGREVAAAWLRRLQDAAPAEQGALL